MTIVFLTSCKFDSAKDKGFIEDGKPVLSIALKKDNKNNLHKFDDIFKESRIISLKSKDSTHFVASVSKVISFRDKFYCLDDRFSSLVCFDKDGKYIAKYGELGLSPNQYKKITDFDIDSTNDRIVVFSNEDRALYYYSINDAAFKKKKKIGLYGSGISVLDYGRILIYKNYSTGDFGKDHNIILIDSDANILRRGLPFNSGTETINWAFTGFLTRSNGGIFCTSAFSDTIYRYKNEKFTPFINVDINSGNIIANRSNHRKLFYSQILLDSTTSFLGSQFFKNDEFIIFTYQNNKRVKTGIYFIKKDSTTIITHGNDEDPLISLVGNPLCLGPDNQMVFYIPRENILVLKDKHPDLFDKLSPDNKKAIEHVNDGNEEYLLVSQLQ